MNKRCPWVPLDKPFYVQYHDDEWGVPSHDDRHLFEMLILEGAQAGLSWETILKKREGYRAAFHNFDVHKVAAMTDEELTALRDNPAIIRNRLKIYAARKNAHVFIALQKEYGSFAKYLWRFVDGVPVKKAILTSKKVIPESKEVILESKEIIPALSRDPDNLDFGSQAGEAYPPASTPLSDRIAKDLKKRGMTFVGTTIIYAFLQAVGVVNDHSLECYKSTS